MLMANGKELSNFYFASLDITLKKALKYAVMEAKRPNIHANASVSCLFPQSKKGIRKIYLWQKATDIYS